MNLRKIATVAASSALIFAAPIAAFASDATTIVNSGDNATVYTSSNQNSAVTVNNTNTALVNQMVNASTNTGDNKANGNISTGTTGTSIVTGDAGVTANFNVDANRNTTVVGQTNPASANLTDVTNTGDGALVNTSTNTNSAIQVNNTNTAAVTQSCGGVSLGLDILSTDHLMGGCSANTGDNHANDNIGGAAISTGQAGIGTNFQTTVNRNQTVVGDPLSMASSGSVLDGTSITNTGDHATVFTSNNTNSSVGVNNSNDALITQMLDAMTNSGDNHASGNVGGSAVLTGDAGITSNMNVTANTNATGIGSGFGMTPLMSNLNDFVNTGDDLNANTSTNANSATTLNNTSALLSSQFVYTHSNSGYNKTNSNVGMTLIGTTGAGVNGSMSIGGNTNTTVLGGLLNSLLTLLLM